MLVAFARASSRRGTLRRELLVHELLQLRQLLGGPVSSLVLIPHRAPLVPARRPRPLEILADILPLLAQILNQVGELLFLLLAPLPLVAVRIIVAGGEPVNLLRVSRGKVLGNLQEGFTFGFVEPRAAAALLQPTLKEEIVRLPV